MYLRNRELNLRHGLSGSRSYSWLGTCSGQSDQTRGAHKSAGMVIGQQLGVGGYASPSLELLEQALNAVAAASDKVAVAVEYVSRDR